MRSSQYKQGLTKRRRALIPVTHLHMMSSAGSVNVAAIYIVGPSSTGKTTLCNALAARLGLSKAVHITEVARTVMRKHGFTRDDVGRLEMQRAIMDAQLEQDMRARRASIVPGERGIVLSDRSAVDAVVCAALDGADSDSRTLISSPNFQAVLPLYRHSLFILLHPISEWMVDDGVRSLEDGQKCLRIFRDILAELGIKYLELGESCRWIEERIAIVRRYVAC